MDFRGLHTPGPIARAKRGSGRSASTEPVVHLFAFFPFASYASPEGPHRLTPARESGERCELPAAHRRSQGRVQRSGRRSTPTVAARGCLPPGANVFVAAPTLAIRSPIDILFMVITMTLVWTVNSTRIRPAMQTPIRQKRQHFRIPYFAPPNAAPYTVPPGVDAPPLRRPSPSRRHCTPG